MTTLTDRYVHAATRRLPDAQRDDVARELRASIEDQSEAARASSPDLTAAEAEEQALLALGDPTDLAAQYRGDQQYLIGPDLYPTYAKVLRALFVTLVPLVTVVVVAVDLFSGGSLGDVIGSLIGTSISMAVQVFVWTTLAFAITERCGGGDELRNALGTWSPDKLPELPHPTRASLAETVSSIVWLAILGGLIVWQQVQSPIHAENGDAIPVLNPDLWSFWIPLILVTLLAEAIFEIAKYRMGMPWTKPFAAINSAVGLLFATPVLWLATQDKLINPDLVAHTRQNWSSFDPGHAHLVIAGVTVLVWALDSFDGWSKALRA